MIILANTVGIGPESDSDLTRNTLMPIHTEIHWPICHCRQTARLPLGTSG